MNVYTSDAVEFFTLVLTSGMIAVVALLVVSAIGFSAAFVLLREQNAAPAREQTAAQKLEVQPQFAFPVPSGFVAGTPVAVAR